MKSLGGGNKGGGVDASSRSSSHTIPAAAKKVVQNLKEIVKKHSDDEIYATLKDCDMDPNHAVHVLMHQDAFHEVKRRRFKRWESGSNNDTRERKAMALAGVRTSDCGVKRQNYVPRDLVNDGSGAKQRVMSTQEDSWPSYRSMESTRFQSLNQTRNVGVRHRSSNTSDRRWTRVSGPTDSESVSATVSLLHSSIHTDSSFGHGAVKRAMVLDRADKEQRGPCNNGVAVLKPVQIYDRSTNHPKFVSVMKYSSYKSLRSQGVRHHQESTIGPSVARRTYDSTRVSHQSSSHVLHPHKTLEWKPKPHHPVASIVTGHESSVAAALRQIPPPTALHAVSIETPTELLSKVEGLKLVDDPPVIIPEHLRVREAECCGLKFGSFDTTDFESSFRVELNDSKCSSVEDSCVSCPEGPTVESLNSSTANMAPVETSTPNHSQLLFSSASIETSDAVLSLLPIAAGQTPEIAQRERQCSEDEERGLGEPQLHLSYDSQPHEIYRPNFVPFADPSPNLFSVFRPGSDVETHHQFLSSHGASKYGGMNASSLEQPQQAGMPHTTLAVGQPSLAVHGYAGAQPAGVSIPPYPTSMYSYQYIPSNYAYMHAPYQTSYPGNSGYLQPPIGSSFNPSGRIYPSAGSTVKFSPPQYKLASGSNPHTMVAAGYGSYQNTPSGFAGTNSNIITGSATSYDDMIGPQYKEKGLYTIASPQVRVHNLSLRQAEASALWVQSQSRDVSRMQANSFYNVHGPGQPTGYMPSQPAHVHHAAGFASYSQSAPTSNNQHLLQQPQSVGTASHAVMFSQPQRNPANWASSYSSLMRSQ